MFVFVVFLYGKECVDYKCAHTKNQLRKYSLGSTNVFLLDGA